MLKKYSIKSIFSQCKLIQNVPGFLLIELMSTILMLGSALILLTSFFLHIVVQQHESKMYREAIVLAKNELQKIKNQKQIIQTQVQHPFTINCYKAPLYDLKSSNISYNCLKKMYEIMIQISWTAFLNKQVKIYSVATILELA